MIFQPFLAQIRREMVLGGIKQLPFISNKDLFFSLFFNVIFPVHKLEKVLEEWNVIKI